MMPRRPFRVLHEVIVEACSPREAAAQAAALHRDEVGADCFTVVPDDGTPIPQTINLAQPANTDPVVIACQVPFCPCPAAPLLQAHRCFCWGHLASYAKHQAAAPHN